MSIRLPATSQVRVSEPRIGTVPLLSQASRAFVMSLILLARGPGISLVGHSRRPKNVRYFQLRRAGVVCARSRAGTARPPYRRCMSEEAPVLIAGGGLTGLAAAAFLAQQGIRSIAVERLKQSSPLPRAAFFHMRTMEMFRGLGIETRVREESAKELVTDGAVIALDCLFGREHAAMLSC